MRLNCLVGDTDDRKAGLLTVIWQEDLLKICQGQIFAKRETSPEDLVLSSFSRVLRIISSNFSIEIFNMRILKWRAFRNPNKIGKVSSLNNGPTSNGPL